MKLLISLLFCFLPGNQKEKVLSESAADKIVRLEIKTLDAIIETEFNISCPQFEHQFEDNIIVKTMKSRAEIETFIYIINNAEAVTDKEHKHIDVRGKITVFYESGKKDIICTSYPASYFIIDEHYFEIENRALSDFIGLDL